MRDKTRQALVQAGQNVDGLSKDYDELVRVVRASEAGMERSAGAAGRMTSGFGNLQSMLLKIGGGAALAKFGKEVIGVRSEIEMMGKSFEALLQGKDKADAMMAAITDYSAKSTYSITNLSKGAQLLIGFGLEAERVMPVMQQLGNIAMGNQDRFSALALAFAQMNAAGKLMGQDLLQMVNAGFNPLMYISEKTGESIGELRKKMEDGAISSRMVAEAFADATAEGGKFHGMLDKQMEGLAGAEAQLKNAWIKTLNEIGESQQGIIAGGYKLSTTLVRNYETVGKVLVGLIATYGTYRAAVMAAAAAENLRYQSTLAGAAGLTKMQAITTILREKTALLNKTMLNNPYVLVATAIVGLVATLWALHKKTDEQAASLKRLKALQDDYTRSVEAEKTQIDILFGRLKAAREGTEEYQRAKDNIISKYGTYLEGLGEEIRSLKEVESAYKAISEAAIQAAKDRAIEKGSQDAVDAYTEVWAEKIGKIRTEFVKKFGEAQGELLLDSLKESIASGGDLSQEVRLAIGAFNKEFSIARVEGAGGAWEQSINDIESYLDEIARAKGVLNREVKELESIFGKVAPKVENKDEETVFSKINTELKAAQSNVDQLKKKLAGLRSGKTQSMNYAKDIEEAEKALEAAEKRLSTLTGKDKKTVAKEESAAEKAGRLKTEQAARKQQIREYVASLVSQQKQGEFDIRQARIDAMKDGVEKEKSAIALHYDKLIEENRLRQEKWVKDLQSKSNLDFENKNPDWKKKGMERPTVTADDLTEEQQKQLNDYGDAAIAYRKSAEEKLTKDLSDKYRDYAARRMDIEKDFNADLAAMYDANGNLVSGITQASVDELKRQMTEALAELDNEFARTKTSIETLFDDMVKKTPAQMREIAAQAQGMADFVSGGIWDADRAAEFGIKTEAQFKQLNAEWAKSPEKLAAIKKAIAELYDTADAGETAFNKMAAGLKKIFSATGQADLASGLDALAEGLGSVTEMADMFTHSLKNIAELSGSEIFGQIADGISTVMDVANSTVQGAQAGAAFGPMGAAVGAALGLVSSITSALAAGKAQAEKNAKLTTEMIRQQYVGEKEVNRLYRERYDWSQRVGETNLEYVRRVGEELKRQRAEAEQDTNDYWKKLQGSQYYSYLDNGKRSGWLGDWSVKDVDPHWAGATSLQGKSEKEMDELYHQGRLTDEAKAWYELWLQAKEERNDLLKKEEEELERIRELTTGSSYNSITTSIIEGFKAGKRSAADFADTFEQLMQNAVLSALSLSADDKMRQWYEDFAEAGKDGYTKEEIEKARQQYMDYIAQLAGDADMLRQVTGVDFSSTTHTGNAGAFTTMTQDQGTKLEGLFTSVQMHAASIDEQVTDISAAMYRSLDTLLRIADNTEYCRLLKNIAEDTAQMIRDGLKMK